MCVCVWGGTHPSFRYVGPCVCTYATCICGDRRLTFCNESVLRFHLLLWGNSSLSNPEVTHVYPDSIPGQTSKMKLRFKSGMLTQS